MLLSCYEEEMICMASLTSTINIQVDTRDKDEATNLLKDLGLNMSTYLNMALKQLIKNGGIPFEVKNPRPSPDLLEALEEGEQIIEDIKAGKKTGYRNVNEMMKAIMQDD